ncbi:NAD(P)-binding domain-containing protein [Candidatus Bathyarchaeota archaeon]|nr:NAD(P)-binding domain-containing protein [Candidatus Bathyarchaeota archaeon]
MRKKEPSILVVGLGQIGYHDAEYMTSRGLNVDGYDIDPKTVQRAIDHGIIRKKAETFEGYDCYVIAVSTHNPTNMLLPSFDALFQTVYRLSIEGKRNALVTIESTVKKGMSRRVEEILGHRLHVAHVPHRFYAMEKEEHGVRQTRVLGGCENCCRRKALRFYQEVLDIPVHIARSIEIAELSKVIENSYRFMEIAFAEELKMFCEAYTLNFTELRDAINSKWNVRILEADHGIGGHCLPKDSQMYVDLTKRALVSSIIDAAKMVDGHYKLRLPQAPSFGMILPSRLLEINATSN